MSQSASQAIQFYREVAENRKLYTIRDKNGFPTPKNSEEKRSQPFWSSKARVEKIIKNVEAYSGFEVVELAWEIFTERWAPGLTNDGIPVGVNWSGENVTGYDIEPKEVKENVEAYIAT